MFFMLRFFGLVKSWLQLAHWRRNLNLHTNHGVELRG